MISASKRDQMVGVPVLLWDRLVVKKWVSRMLTAEGQIVGVPDVAFRANSGCPGCCRFHQSSRFQSKF